VRALYEQVAVAMAGKRTIGAFWHGLRTRGVDGFVLDVAETEANRELFDGPTGSKGTGQVCEVGYPQARVVTLVETGTRAAVRAAIGGYRTGEHELAEQLAGAVGKGDLVLFDRNFPGVRLFKAFAANGAKVVMRAKRHIARTNIQPLPDGTYLAEMWTDGRAGVAGGEHVTVRVIEYRIDDGEMIRLITDLLDPEAHPAAEIAALYIERWQSECGNKQLKTLQMGSGSVLRSGDPALVRQEIWAHLLVNFCLTRLITTIADERGEDPDRISFTKVLKEVRRTVIQQATRAVSTAVAYAMDIADDLRRYVNPEREPRISERTVKRRRQRFPVRKADTIGKPVTVKAPPKILTLLPLATC
jgi:Transposase DDE domain